jgi:hypothetical protein
MLANQGLDSDKLYQETATRFQGVEDAAKAKVELVARVMAETGFRELYEGIAWMISHNQDDKREIFATGKPVTIDPTKWRYDHRVASNVGLAAGDNEQILNNMGALLTIQNQLKSQRSLLVDDKKIFNVIDKSVKAMELSDTSKYFNDPEVPQQTLLSQNEQLMAALEEAKMQLDQSQNPLAEAETIKARADLVKAQGKMELDIAKLQEDQRQFNAQMGVKLTELELQHAQDVPGSRV